MSEQDVVTKGPSLNFKKDTNGFKYDDILGEVNQYGEDADGNATGNIGAYDRMLETSNAEAGATDVFKTMSHHMSNEVSHVEKVDDKTYLFHFYVRIPLKHVNELYARLPLLRGAVQEIYLQIHTVTYDTTGRATALNLTTTHGSTPYMISDSKMFLKEKTPAIAPILAVGAIGVRTATTDLAGVGGADAIPYRAAILATYEPATIKFSSGIAKVLNKAGATMFHHKTHCELIAKI